jgi:hypothetical protein
MRRGCITRLQNVSTTNKLWALILDSGFSSIAVDDKDNEVAMTDENLFQIVTYDRLTCWY